MNPAIGEPVARKLYEQWCDDFGNPTPADWDLYEAGASLNGGDLRADNFRESAEAIAPFDNAEAVARRMCLDNGIPECHGHKWPACTETTCVGWKEWLPYAEQVVELVRALALSD